MRAGGKTVLGQFPVKGFVIWFSRKRKVRLKTPSASHLQLTSTRRVVKCWKRFSRGTWESSILDWLSCEHLQALKQSHPTFSKLCSAQGVGPKTSGHPSQSQSPPKSKKAENLTGSICWVSDLLKKLTACCLKKPKQNYSNYKWLNLSVVKSYLKERKLRELK